MAISFVGSVAAINNAPLSLPAHNDRDMIILFTAGDTGNVPSSPTPGFNNTEINTSPFPRPLGTIPGMLVESIVSDGTLTTIPANLGTGDFSRIAVIYRGTNFNNPNSALQFMGENLSTTDPKTRVKFPAATTPGVLERWYVNFTAIVTNGDATDLSAPPASLTRRATLVDQQRIAVYDSNANVVSYPDTNGPPFSTGDHEWRSLGCFLYVLDGAYLKSTLQNVGLLSTAEIKWPPPPIGATLETTISINLDSTAHIPQVRKANLDIQLENVTLDSTAEITLPEITAELVEGQLEDVTLLATARHGIDAWLVNPLEDVTLKSKAQVSGRVANLTAILDDVKLVSTAQISGAHLTAILDDVKLVSKAQIKGAELVAILDDVRLESEAIVKPIEANLGTTLEDVVLRSEATITQPVTWQHATDCCTPSLCSLDPCALICNFVSILPNGPLWDEPKRRVLEEYSTSQYCATEPRRIGSCGSVVDHAVYTALKLYDILRNGLYPAIRESNPMTAYDTMDDWLERLNWKNCVQAGCTMPGINGVLPIQISGPCGIDTCEVEYPDCLNDAVKHGIIVALTRLQFGGIKNLCFINNVIEPLGAVIFPTPGREAECPNKFILAPTTLEFPVWTRDNCLPQVDEFCQAYIEPDPCGPPIAARVFPGLIAAECIVRSMLPQYNFIHFQRECEVPAEIPNCFTDI